MSSSPHADAAADVPAWFHNRVVMGVQFLFALSLPGTPAGEVIPLTATAWITSLWASNVLWDEEQDSARIYQAFTAVAAKADRWPAPRTLMDHMPQRRQRLALPGPGAAPTAEQRARMAQLCRRRTDFGALT